MAEKIVLEQDSNIKTKAVERPVDTPADFTSPEELYQDLIAEIKKYHPSTDMSDIEKAYKTAYNAHQGQKRKSGEPYIIHPLCVAIILAELELDKETIIAGLLHDVVEDTVMTSEDVAREFGDEVALLVDGVTKLTQLNYQHHVLASGRNVNVLVFDTEVYSNTGGQASKATNIGAVAQFAAGGKDVKKKDLAGIAMSYGYVYVAQIAMGADRAQCLKAIAEAEAYDGPSLIIAYAPCINHGIKGGLTIAQQVEKEAVEAGYWQLFRFNPDLVSEGKSPFSLDSKEPTGDPKAFMMREVRYNSLMRANPDRANALFDKAVANFKAKYTHLVELDKAYKDEFQK